MNSETELSGPINANSEEIPSKTISIINEEKQSEQFSPIKFGGNEEIVDEEITIKHMARKNNESDPLNTDAGQNLKLEDGDNLEVDGGNFGISRKSDEDIFNTPKRERHFEDQNLNIRRSREMEDDQVKTPQKCYAVTNSKNELVKSLSMEFEQRLASIHVSPKVSTSNTFVPPRSMSPVRSVASDNLSPIRKLIFNEDEEVVEVEHVEHNKVKAEAEKDKQLSNNFIEEPKLISPSKIVSAASAVEMERIKVELENKVNNIIIIIIYCIIIYF